MKRMLLPMLVLFLFSCGSNSEETRTEEKTQQSLDELNKMIDQYKDEGVVPDTATSEVPRVYTEMDYVGRRNVILITTETDCNDKQVGDTRGETWSISITGGNITMKVNSDTKTIDDYSGEMSGEQMILKGKKETLLGSAGQATVKLWLNEDGKLEGTRKLSSYDKDSNPCSTEQSIKEQ